MEIPMLVLTSARAIRHVAACPQSPPESRLSHYAALLEADNRSLNHLSAAERAMLLELLHKVALHRPG